MELNFKSGKTIKNDIQKKQIEKVNMYISEKDILKQNLKGEVENKEIRFPKDLGEQHPFDVKLTEELYKNFGVITAAVDKYVDFIVGPGFYVTSEDLKAQTIIQQFNQDVNMDVVLRAWIKEAIVKHSGFLELGGGKNENVKGIKVLDSKSIYAKRDARGNIEKYNQFKGDLNKFSMDKVIPFEEYQIAQIKFNNIGDDAYGQGLIYPSLKLINHLFGLQINMNLLMQRKANAPYHVKIGSIEKDIYPSPQAVANFGKDLEWLNNKHEWCTDALVEIKAVDFGALGDKFEFPLRHYLDLIYASLQIPKILMGEDVNLAVAPVQMDAFQRRIQSIQAEVEKVIETKIYKRVLNAQGIDEHVEFEWGQPSTADKNERIRQITELLKLFNLSPKLAIELQMELAKLMGLKIEQIKPEELVKEQTDNTQQPKVPGQNKSKQMLIKQAITDEDIIKSQNKIYEDKEENECNCGSHLENKSDYNLKEWLDFNYDDYLNAIIESIKQDKFELLAALDRTDIKLGRLGQTQINSLKRVLIDGFNNNISILELTEDIKQKVNIRDLVDEEGNIRALADNRAYLIARTETTRMSNLGAAKHFQNEGAKKYRWVSTLSERTSDICRNLNGRIFEFGKGPLPPAHINCRSTITVVEE